MTATFLLSAVMKRNYENVPIFRGINGQIVCSALLVPFLSKLYWHSPYDEQHTPPFISELNRSTDWTAKNRSILHLKASNQLLLILT